MWASKWWIGDGRPSSPCYRDACTDSALTIVAAFALLVQVLWGVTSATAAPLSQETGDDWARVQAAGKLVVGTSADYPPFEFYNSNYELDGFDIALIREIADRLGVEVEFKDFAFGGLLDALRLGQVDVAISAISVTPDRQQIVDFTNLYYVLCERRRSVGRSQFQRAGEQPRRFCRAPGRRGARDDLPSLGAAAAG